jgi:hypothetical protein
VYEREQIVASYRHKVSMHLSVVTLHVRRNEWLSREQCSKGDSAERKVLSAIAVSFEHPKFPLAAFCNLV